MTESSPETLFPKALVPEASLDRAIASCTQHLVAAWHPEGGWKGELSPSALSTATAATALHLAVRHGCLPECSPPLLAVRALDWLVEHQNPDGGWGDTPASPSNISTTTLVWAAFGLGAASDARGGVAVQRAEAWLRQHAGGLDAANLSAILLKRYGGDRTFSVPILTMCALSGRFGEGAGAWHHVIPLPFELAALPRSLFATLGLPVVSYALPALIAMGHARHAHAPSGHRAVRWLRSAVKERVFRLLNLIQPPNGGFLEATPLTSFVVMSLLASGESAHPVARRGLEFLVRSARADGSWQIDTNLATWVTSLAVHALSAGGEMSLSETARHKLRDAYLRQQYRNRHQYTDAPPGGWAWTDLPGGVPDADDTSGALLALKSLGNSRADRDCVRAATDGVGWLLNLQNSDGGIPTFCRGWGRLPFDRSSADLTAHALRAWHAWRNDLPERIVRRVDPANQRALRFLEHAQDGDGSWSPLWFGSETEPDEVNHVYGTSRVLLALGETGSGSAAARRGAAWLVRVQNADGGWSGGAAEACSSTEETALAVEAVAEALARWPTLSPTLRPSLERGVSWLLDRVERNTWTRPSTIGLYFAKLWYSERLYPVVFTVAALRRARQVLASPGVRGDENPG